GLAAYADAVQFIRTLTIPGLERTDGFGPLLLYPPAALVTASVRHGQRAQAYRDEVLARATRMTGRTDSAGFVDVPILGCGISALAVWELVYGDRTSGERLLAYAERFAFSRMLPSFDWSWATSLGQPAHIGNRKPPELLGELHALLAQLD